MHAFVAVVIGLFAQVGPGAGPVLGDGALSHRAYGDITVGDPVVTHGSGSKPDRALVKRYLRRETPKIRFCYERSLAAAPTLRGALSIRFRVQPDGKLTAVRVEGVDDDVENCVARFVRAMQVPAVLAGAEVRTKVTLRPSPPAIAPRGGCRGPGCGTIGHGR